MKKYKIAILGATGVVGQAMLKALEERNFPVEEIKLLASKRSAGKEMVFKNKKIVIEETTHDSFEHCDFVFGAVENDLSMKYAPSILKAKALFIDNSSAFRLDHNVPLVVPEINGEDILNHHGIIANPNCSTIIGCMAIYGIHQMNPIRCMNVATYQAVSGAGINGMKEYENQLHAIVNHEEIKPNTFPYQIASNVIPQIGGFNEDGYTSEEMKLQNEGRKILHAPQLNVTCTCVRVPVLRSHSLSMTIECEHPLDISTIKSRLHNTKGCKFVDDPLYPMPLDTSNQDLVYVGRLRKDLCHTNGITLWCCGDQIRKGAAVNAIQIAEKWIELNERN